jgi:hypothetical protein
MWRFVSRDFEASVARIKCWPDLLARTAADPVRTTFDAVASNAALAVYFRITPRMRQCPECNCGQPFFGLGRHVDSDRHSSDVV